MAAEKPEETRAQRVTDIIDEPLEFIAPITGYEKERLVSLEQAVKPLVKILPTIESHVYVAKQKCKQPDDNLTRDESAAIMLYTMGWQPHNECLYFVLNETLRAPDRNETLKPWYLYIRLFLNALFRLSPLQKTVYRGVRLDISDRYIKGNTIVWWGFSSCTTSVDVLKSKTFLGETGNRTIFNLHCQSARSIRNHSYYAAEEEVLLLAATQFKVVGCLKQGDLHIIQLEENPPPVPLLQPVPIIVSPSSMSVKTMYFTDIPVNARWSQNGITIAGGFEAGGATNQLHSPLGLYIDEARTMFITDEVNQRIVQWKSDAMRGEVVAGNKGQGNQLDQLDTPTNAIVDKEENRLIICDWGNQRVMQWSLQTGTINGEILISNTRCFGLTMDDQRFLYVSDQEKHEVRRYEMGEATGIVVAGGNGKGDKLNQLNSPRDVFVDRDYSVYVSDSWNHRVIKWMKGAKEGIVVAGGRGDGNDLNRLSLPNGLFIDSSGNVYVAEGGNNRVTRWRKGTTQGELIVGGNEEGFQPNQFNYPRALSFDQHGNLFVADNGNHRVQSFSIKKNDLL